MKKFKQELIVVLQPAVLIKRDKIQTKRVLVTFKQLVY